MKRHTLLDPNVQKRLEALPALYATENKKGDRSAVKLFYILGEQFWVIWEYDKDQDLGFGFSDLCLGFGEMGYIPISTLREMASYIERDTSVETLVDGYASRGIALPEFVLESV